MLTAKAAFTGLMTAIAETLAPGGALRKADNVVIRKTGIVEPRQAFQPVTIGYDASGLTFLNAAVMGLVTLYETISGWKNAGGTTLQYSRLDDDASPVLVTPARMRADSFSTVESRGNLYFPTQFGLLRLTDPTNDTQWTAACLSVGQLGIVPLATGVTGPGPLPAGYQWSYRIVGVREDANDLIVRSRPTGAVVAQNPTGGPLGGLVTFTVRPPRQFTYVEVYRTRAFPNTAQPDDEMALVGTVYTVPDSGTHTYNFFDKVPDSQRGASLYTSPSREGSESSHDLAPAASCIESYRGCVFLGNIVGQQRFIYSFTAVQGTAGTGLGSRSITYNCTNGSPTITSVSPTTGIIVGQLISNASSVILTITAVAGSTLTLSGNASITATGRNGTVWDAIYLDGIPMPSYGLGSLAVYTTIYQSKFGSYQLTPALPGYTETVVVETILPNQAPFTIAATSGSQYNPPLPNPTDTPLTSSADTFLNGLVWSNPDEPEHFPVKNFALISQKTEAILGLKATRDSLFIFKEDGIFRLSGINGEWQIDPFDLTTFCVLPSSIQRLDNRIYLLSNKGVVAVDETGVEVVSRPVYDQVAKLVDDARANFASLGYYKLTGLSGVASAVDDRNFEYLLHVGSNTLDCGGNLLVYNTQTQAWTTFSFSASGFASFSVSGMSVDPSGKPLLLHAAGARAASYSVIALGSEIVPSRADQSAAITVSSAVQNGAEAAVTYSPATTLIVGDVLACSNGYFAVTSVTSSTVVNVAAAYATPATGGGTVYRSMTCTVQPQAFSIPQLTAKKWTHAVWALSRFVGAVKASALFSSATVNLDQASQTTTEPIPLPLPTGYTRHSLGTLLRSLIPNEHARGWLMRAGITWTMAFGDALLELVGADSTQDAPNRNQQNSTGTT